MVRRKFTREFKLKAVKLIKERRGHGGTSRARFACTVLRRWVRECAADPQQIHVEHDEIRRTGLHLCDHILPMRGTHVA